jgi:hypothetical protein
MRAVTRYEPRLSSRMDGTTSLSNFTRIRGVRPLRGNTSEKACFCPVYRTRILASIRLRKLPAEETPHGLILSRDAVDLSREQGPKEPGVNAYGRSRGARLFGELGEDG